MRTGNRSRRLAAAGLVATALFGIEAPEPQRGLGAHPGMPVATLVAAARDLPLIDAARNGDTEAVRALIVRGTNVDAAEADGTTALLWASYREDLASADLLLRAGADVNAANDLGATPLWAASQNGSADMVARLLEAGADPNRSLLLGETPLMVASRSGNPRVVEQLLAKGANADVRAARGQTALMWAVAQKHPDVVKVLLTHGAEVSARSDVWSQVMAVTPHGHLDYNRSIPHGGDTALMFAARVGDLDSAKLLVSAGAGVGEADAWGVSPLIMASHAGFADLVDFLLDEGADPNDAGAGFSALHAAVMRRDERMVSALLEHGADPNAPLRTWTPTRRASRDYNFDPPLVGASPFWLAARFGGPAVMRLLVTKGADPRFVHEASYYAGEPAQPRTQKTTAVMAALGMGGGTAWVQPDRVRREALALEAVQLAVEHGVDVNAENTDGRTAVDAARALRYDSVVTFLVEKGARAGTKR